MLSHSSNLDLAQDEAHAIFDRDTRKFDKFIAEFFVCRSQRFVGADGFFEILLAFFVWVKDFLPRRGDEDAAVVTKLLGCVDGVLRNRQTRQPKVSGDIQNSAIEEDSARVFLCETVRAHLPGKHEFREQDAVGPRKGRASDIYLILDDAAARFDAARIAEALEGVDERAFSGPRAAGQDEKTVCGANQNVSPCVSETGTPAM